jgi:hypothetical protein
LYLCWRCHCFWQLPTISMCKWVNGLSSNEHPIYRNSIFEICKSVVYFSWNASFFLEFISLSALIQSLHAFCKIGTIDEEKMRCWTCCEA